MKFTFLLASITALLLSACGASETTEDQTAEKSESSSASVTVDTTINQLYVFEVWDTDATTVDSTLSASTAVINKPDLASRMVLKARNEGRVVQITTWNSEAAAEEYATDAMPDDSYKILTSKVVNHGSKDAKLAALDTTSSVQYSEFLMKRKSAVDTLSTIAKGMTTAMVRSEPTLDFIMTLNSTDSSTISLFGIWNTEEGFEVFSENNTFGDRPYWEPYADNEHHMFEVVVAQ
ncbi:hypothetical protein [Tunicatimonas pelagia]|uniref:hypothetical protein n=1 Tax=Tunicatimonas pelagia TaxID=931531 RepID=UPI00266632C4|nr:hypothetical protein [Tunicatimonas pelagia]WKN41745.1 hypothetical protein P0M28_22160 [Tunicatimonas pelagia]